ncbi:MAG: hypothetical protein HONDAALG_02639 [Gammaproteobacteria bacterium]|nr:hypothetical protein [Gammaproteobacteria bacterium]
MTDDFDSTELTEESYETAAEILARDSVYGEIKRALIVRGIPAEEIAFIHDYTTPAKKARVFAEVNAGKIRVLIGSTEKMGIGSNFQERLVGLHHLSPCFRPADIQQREGRILRQGNIFPEVHICTYVTENSFDAFMWGLVESKARFISQIMAGEVTARTAEDVDQLVMTAAQIKAIASGNPQILEKVAVEVELTKLERLYSAWSASRQRLRRQMESLPSYLESVTREIASHQKTIATRDQNERDDFTIELRRDVSSEEALTFTDRGRAGAHLRQLCFVVARESRSTGGITRLIGRYRGFEIIARASGRQLDALSSLFSETDLFLRAGEGEPSYGINLGESDAGVTQSMDAQLRGLEGKLEKSLAAQAELEHRQQQITAELNKGFEPAARYEELRLRLNTLNRELTKAGVEIEGSPELSNLDEEAFHPVESGVSVHQILSLTEQSVGAGEEKVVAFDGQMPIVSETSVVEPKCVIGGAAAADPRLAQSDNGANGTCTMVEAEDQSKNGLFTLPDKEYIQRSAPAERVAASKSATARGPSQQMCFNWS